MKFLDLFSGIGGFRLGMQQARHECVGWCEWDKFARKSYQAIYNPEGEWTAHDIRAVRSYEIPKADCWCFGFPCQDISLAGKQRGITDGKRSSLFFTVTQLIRNTPEKDRPSYLFIENVKNLLSINRGFDFLKLQIELDEIGYDVEWSVLDSAEVVPQHRERLFIIGHLREQRTRKVFPIIRKNGETNKAIKEVARINPNRHSSDANSVIDPSGISHTVTAHSYKDVPKILDDQGRTKKRLKPLSISPTLRNQSHGNEPKIAIPVSSPDRIKKRQNGRRFKTNGKPEFTLTGQDRHGILTNGMRVRKLTPLEAWRLQGFPDWAFDCAKAAGLSDSQLYKQAGNSVTVPVIKNIAERMAIEW